MALRFHFLSPKPLKQLTRFQTNPYPSPFSSTAHLKKRNASSPKLQISISCTKKDRFNDAELASKLATEIDKLNKQMVQREEALTKSRELLFKEVCNYMELEAEEVKKKWRRMSEEDKWVVVKGFVSKWGSNFHPLSARSVQDLVDDYLVDDKQDLGGGSGSGTMLFPSLNKLMGFSQ